MVPDKRLRDADNSFLGPTPPDCSASFVPDVASAAVSKITESDASATALRRSSSPRAEIECSSKYCLWEADLERMDFSRSRYAQLTRGGEGVAEMAALRF
jgi:hypothetical protein